MRQATPSLTILHTSDWHLGRTLFGRKRYEEFAAFLDWLELTIRRESVDVLLLAGDVFDSGTPSNRAQELYYRFLGRLADSCCRHAAVIAGNHDSASFLNAPKELLKAMRVHVVGAACPEPEDEVLVLRDAGGRPELIVCAVPFLRERDIRQVEPGESVRDKERKSLEGIRRHYERVFALAEGRNAEFGGGIPIVGMGHLFAAGGRTVEGDGVRDLYVGSLAHVPADIFPESLSYTALGHLHVPQAVNGRDNVRYSGSPLPMGFGEAKQEKSVCLFEPGCGSCRVRLVPVPVFQSLERIRGGFAALEARIGELARQGSTAWLEIVYDGEEVINDLRGRLAALTEGTGLEILKTGNARLAGRILARQREGESLADLDCMEVFQRCLAARSVPEEQRPGLLQTYRESLGALAGQDKRRE